MNKKLIFLCIIILIIPLIFVPTTSIATEIVYIQNTQTKGDLNNNGTIDMGDIIQILRHIASTSNNTNKEWILSEEKQKLVDLNNNNNIDIGDIMVALRYWAANNNKDISKKHPEWLKIEKKTEKKVEVTSIKLNTTYNEIFKGSTFKLEATIKPENASNKTIEWSSSDEKIATVSQTGLVTAINAGKAKITAKTSNGKTSNCTIVVKPIYVEELTLNKKEIAIVTGKAEKLEAIISNSNKVDNASVEWSSSNEKVATVSQTGLVTGIKKGTATITVKAKDGSGKKATCKVTVIQPVTGITFKENEIVLTPGKTRTIAQTISPSDASNKEVEWSSSDSSIASIDTKGKVTALKKGITTITAKAKDGSNVYATCKVEVAQPVTSIKIEKEITLNTGTTKTLKAEITPSIANNKDITWISSNEKVATVSQTGEVKGIKKGTATITAKAKDGSGVYAKCKVNVLQIITQIKLDKTQATMYENDTLKLIPEITPINANNRELKWTSSNANIASVDAYGNVTAKKKGTALITVATKDGSKKSATCKITVKEKTVTKITLNTSNLSLKVGESKTLIAKVEPENAKNKTITWKSSNAKVATVSKTGVVKGVKEGSTTITATSNGKYATCTVKVNNNSTQTNIENETTTANNGKIVTKAQLANFRNVYAGNIGKNTLYRCINPIKGSAKHKKAANYADQMLRKHNVHAILNLSNKQESILKDCYADSTYYKKLYKEGKVYGKYMDVSSDKFRKELTTGLKFFVKNDGPYAIHCVIGRDRTGFAILLLECLMNVPYDYMYNDYVLSYKNLNLIGRTNSKESTYNNEFSKYLKRLTNKSASDTKHPKASDWKNVSFVKCAETYLKKGGMSSSEITKLKNNLSKNH